MKTTGAQMVSEGNIKLTDKTAKPRVIRGKNLRLVMVSSLLKARRTEKRPNALGMPGTATMNYPEAGEYMPDKRYRSRATTRSKNVIAVSVDLCDRALYKRGALENHIAIAHLNFKESHEAPRIPQT